MCFLRLLELIFALFLFVHIPIAILIDSQSVLEHLKVPSFEEYYPEQAIKALKWYVVEFKDPYVVNSPTWFISFVFTEMLFQLPFCIIGGFAFLLGSKSWIRMPAILYSTHIITTLIPSLYSIYVDDFAKMNRVGPVTQEERLRLMAFYIPYLIIPLLMLLTMLISETYKGNQTTAVASKAVSQQKSSQQKKKQYSNKKQQ